MFAECFTDILSSITSFVNLLFTLEIDSGVTVGSVMIAVTLLALILNLLNPAVSSQISLGKSIYHSAWDTTNSDKTYFADKRRRADIEKATGGDY